MQKAFSMSIKKIFIVLTSAITGRKIDFTPNKHPLITCFFNFFQTMIILDNPLLNYRTQNQRASNLWLEIQYT